MNLIFKSTFLAIILSCFSLTPANAQNSKSDPEPVPLFTLSDQNGNQVSLQSFRGKVVMINFWATWCPPCVKELPTMEALKKTFTDQPFEILAINMGEDKETISRFVERMGFDFSFPLLIDADSRVSDLYQVRGLPATMVIDKQGTFIFGGIGERDWNSNAVRDEIQPLLEK